MKLSRTLSAYPMLTRMLLLLALPLLVAGAILYGQLRAGLPQQQGRVAVTGTLAPLTIARDAQGVPHLVGASDRDVFFGMGYVHAQDRMWQLEVQRRIAGGRLSEVFGRASLGQDILLRTLGLYPAARASWASLDPAAQASLTAYAAGVNAWLAGQPRLGPEFALLGMRPQAWTVYDSLAWMKVFSLNLSGNMNAEIGRYFVSQELTKGEMAVFLGGPAGAHPAPKQDRPLAAHLLRLGEAGLSLERTLGLTGKFVGSNAWAVAGSFTGGTGAMLANDPHTGLQIPSIWYPVSQRGDRLRSSGMSLVGLPLVIFGQNGQIAWGGTNMTADVQDLYFEQADPQDPTRYRHQDGWLPFSTRTEKIGIKAEFPAALRQLPDPVELVVRESRHGPLLGDALAMSGQAVALRWSALDPDDQTYGAFLRLNYAADWTTFRAALSTYASPPLNMLYADRQGNIGLQGIGKVPLRPRGNGALPSDGASNADDWQGYIPFAAMPSTYNPARGYLVSANNKNVGADYPYFISNDWAPPARAERIGALLEQQQRSGAPFTPAHFQQIQADVVSLPARAMLAQLTGLPARSERQRQALGYLRAWHGEMDAASQAATIFNVWMRHAKDTLFTRRLQRHWDGSGRNGFLDALVERVSVSDLHAILAGRDDSWCQHGSAAAPRACSRLMLQALDGALDELEKYAGRDMADWRWGSVHHTRYLHTPFSQVKLLDKVFERRMAQAGGSVDTVNVAADGFVLSEGYLQGFGASFRQVMHMQPTGVRHLYMNSTGQSGNVASAHYADMTAPFARAELIELPADQPRPALTLVPRTTDKLP